MHGRKLSGLIRCAAVLCVFLALAGCKPSPAFVETVYDDRARETDEQANVSEVENDEENTDEDTELPPQEFEEDVGKERGREREDPTAGEEERENDAPKPEHNEDANPDEGPDAGEPTPEPPEETAPPPEEPAETPPPAPEPEASPAPEAPPEPGRQVVDAAGRRVDLPEAVEHVAAVGEAAVLVEMLGGAGRLTAASASLAAGLSGELLGHDCELLWSGDGHSPLSEEGFSRLLALAPQACLEISGQMSFTEEQLSALEAAGIAYVVLPSLNTDEGIKQAVALIGQVLGSEGELNAQQRSEEYLAFHDRVLALLASRVSPYLPDGVDYATGNAAGATGTEGVTALYISGWDATASWSLHDDAYETLSGTGLPYTETGYLRSPVTYYLSLAGVANAAALKENNYSIKQSKLKYLSPIHSPNKTLSVEGSAGIGYDPSYVFTSAGGVFLGESGFPFVIAASEEVKSGVEESPLWQDYGMTGSATGLTSGYGFLDSNGDIVISTVHGPYTVLVLPSGVGSWAEGSAESVLTTLWAACKLRGAVSEGELRAFTAEFYERFYGVKLSEGQLDRILHEGSE